jgi:hypothetical protein
MGKLTGRRLTQLADAASRQSARKVIERAEAAGVPIIVYLNGKITALEPEAARKMCEMGPVKPKRRAKQLLSRSE